MEGGHAIATSQLLSQHIRPGRTIAQSIKEGLDYGRNPFKTRDGDLVLSYMCDSETAEAEFLLSKAQYYAITGRRQKKENDVLYYHVRQSFKVGEIDHDAALKVGYDLAMRWTKGKHAFIVVSHTDRPHPHIHVYYNSTALDCTRKFRDFKCSARALRRLSDRICYENGLSVVENPKPKSKGKYKHYGEWQGDNKAPTFQQRLKEQIDLCLDENPADFAEFLQAMETTGYEVKQRRGAISFRTEGQTRFARLNAHTLGKGYDPEGIREAIEARRTSPPGGRSETPTRRLNLIVDIQTKMREGKGAAYKRWATIYNLKAMATALQYLQENDLLDYKQLEKKAQAATAHLHTLSDQMKSIETDMQTNRELRAALVDWAKTRAVFEGYKAEKYSNKYLAEHEADIQLHRSAQAELKRILQGAKLPKMATLKAEAARLKSEKNAVYREYRAAREDMKTVITAKANIDTLLGITGEPKSKAHQR